MLGRRTVNGVCRGTTRNSDIIPKFCGIWGVVRKYSHLDATPEKHCMPCKSLLSKLYMRHRPRISHTEKKNKKNIKKNTKKQKNKKMVKQNMNNQHILLFYLFDPFSSYIPFTDTTKC